MSRIPTAKRVSILSRVLRYLDLAGKIARDIPPDHGVMIEDLFGELTQDLTESVGTRSPEKESAPVPVISPNPKPSKKRAPKVNVKAFLKP